MKNKFDIETLSRVYTAQTPSPYIILNDFLDESTAHKLADECDLITEKDYDVNSDGEYDNHEHSNLKRGVKDISKLPPNMQYMCRYFNGDKFMEWLRKLTGNSGLVADDGYHGGGYHHTLPGGHLEVHEDFSYHEELDMWRKVNILYYLNRDWKPGDGGELEIWSKDLAVKHVSVQPVFNRVVIFNVNGTPHGHPTPTKIDRRSLAFYYYDNEPVSEKTTRAHWREGDKLV